MPTKEQFQNLVDMARDWIYANPNEAEPQDVKDVRAVEEYIERLFDD